MAEQDPIQSLETFINSSSFKLMSKQTQEEMLSQLKMLKDRQQSLAKEALMNAIQKSVESLVKDADIDFTFIVSCDKDRHVIIKDYVEHKDEERQLEAVVVPDPAIVFKPLSELKPVSKPTIVLKSVPDPAIVSEPLSELKPVSKPTIVLKSVPDPAIVSEPAPEPVTESEPEPAARPVTRKEYDGSYFGVTFADNSYIEGETSLETFLLTLQKIGLSRIPEVDITFGNINLVSAVQKDASKQIAIDGVYVYKELTDDQMMDALQEISDYYYMDLEIGTEE